MSGINDLQENAASQRVDLTQRATSGRHTVIASRQQPNGTIPTVPITAPATTSVPSKLSVKGMSEIDLTQIEASQQPAEDPNIHKSIAADILEGEDSPFAKYKQEKMEEARRYMEERAAKEELEDEMKESDDSNEGSFESGNDEAAEIGFESSANTDNIGVTAQENVSIDAENLDESFSADEKEDKSDEESAESTNSEDTNVEENKDQDKEKKEDLSVGITEDDNIDLEVTNVEDKTTVVEDENTLDDGADSGVVADDTEVLEHLQKLATERIKPIARKLNLSSFTVMKKPTANLKALQNTDVKAAKWVLPCQNSVVLMKEFLGSELENLREYSEDSTNMSMLYRKYRAIYDHIASPKPATYEAWLKATPFSDVDHYFFAAYIASFKGVNYLPVDCTNKKCGKTYMTEDMPIMNMVKFKDEASKKKFTKLYTSEPMYTGKGLYVSEIVPLNEHIAIGFKEASIYNLFEVQSLSDADKEKYNAIIGIIPYIDAMYIIHQDTQQLEPIGYKIYPENANKTVKAKIATFNKALNTLSPDEFTPINAFIREISNKREDGITYQYPAVKCPYCGTQINAIDVSAESLLFTRYQLGALANTSLK